MKRIIFIFVVLTFVITNLAVAQQSYQPVYPNYSMQLTKAGSNNPYGDLFIYSGSNSTIYEVGKISTLPTYRHAFYQWNITNNDIPTVAIIDSIVISFDAQFVNWESSELNYFNCFLDLSDPNLDKNTLWNYSDKNQFTPIGSGPINTPPSDYVTQTHKFVNGSNFVNSFVISTQQGDRFTLGIAWKYEDPVAGNTYWMIKPLNINVYFHMPIQTVTLDQRLSDNSQVGTLRKWEGSYFTLSPFINPGTPFNFTAGSTQAIQGDQAVHSNEKYHRWFRNQSDEQNVSNHHSFTIETFDNNFTSRFNPTYSGITIRNSLEATSINGGLVDFKDPWLIDYPDPQFAYTKRNQGMDAPFKQRQSPFYPDYTTSYNGDVYQGVFLNQGEQWQPPYYSVKANAMQDILLTNTGVPAGRYHKFYFRNWSADSINGQPSAQFQYPNSLTTPVVFKSENATVQANLKGMQLSNNPNAFSSNSQRKSIRTPNGHLLNLYESLGTIWIEHSTNNGQNWEILENALPFESDLSELPSIDYFPWIGTESFAAAVYYLTNVGSILKLKVITTKNVIEHQTGIGWTPGNVFPVVPVIAVTNNRILIVSTGGTESQEGLVYFYGTVQQSPFVINWTEYAQIIPGSTEYSFNSTVVADKNSPTPLFHIAWEQNGAIKYCRLTESNGVPSFSTVETPSANSGLTNHYNPSISLANGYPLLSWTGKVEPGIWKIMVKDDAIRKTEQRAVVRRGPVWGDFQIVGSKVNFTNNNSVTSAEEKTVITWSEGTTPPQSKWIKRTGASYSIPRNLSHSGIQSQVISGTDYQYMTSIVFNNNQVPYYFIQSTTDFSYLGGASASKIEAETDTSITYGRAGIVSINGVEFVFNLGDVIVNNNPVRFIAKSDTLVYEGYSEINNYTRTEAFQLNNKSAFNFSSLYYVLNKELADSTLNENQSVNFRVELVSAKNNQAIGVFDNITYNKYNLADYENMSYNVNCSGIKPGDYYLRLITTVNTSAKYSLANLVNDASELDKAGFTEINYNGETTQIDYALDQNYPNPFNPVTVIRYQLPESGNVTLKVYDVLGREVKTLVDEQKTTGRYEVTFDAAELASGVYIYQLQSGEYVSSKKMILIK